MPWIRPTCLWAPRERETERNFNCMLEMLVWLVTWHRWSHWPQPDTAVSLGGTYVLICAVWGQWVMHVPYHCCWHLGSMLSTLPCKPIQLSLKSRPLFKFLWVPAIPGHEWPTPHEPFLVKYFANYLYKWSYSKELRVATVFEGFPFRMPFLAHHKPRQCFPPSYMEY